MRSYLILILIALIEINCHAQSEIKLVNDKIIKTKIIGFDNEYLNYTSNTSELNVYKRVKWENISHIVYRDTIYYNSKNDFDILKFKISSPLKTNSDLLEKQNTFLKFKNLRTIDRRVIKKVRENLYLLSDSAYADFNRGVEDAVKYYKSKAAGNICATTVLLGIPTGLATSLIASNIVPPDVKLI